MNTYYRIESKRPKLVSEFNKFRFYRRGENLLRFYGVADCFSAVEVAFTFAKIDGVKEF